MAGKAGRRGWGWIRRRASGRYQASYEHNLTRHYAPSTFATRLRAEGWLAAERELIERGTWTSPAKRAEARAARAISFADYATKWVEQRNLKPRTRLLYESLLRQHITPTIGKREITDITPEVVRSWYSRLGTEHTRRNSHCYGLVHAVMATAVIDGLVPTNPCHVQRAMNTARKREPVVLTIAQLGTLADKVPERFKAAVLISAWCGVRWGELIELRRKDIDTEIEVLYVGRGATHRGECRIDTPKSGKPRAVVIPPHIRVAIRHHLDTCADAGPEGQVFPAQRGGCHLNDRVFRDAIAPALEDVGQPDLRIHDLRHFAGTQVARVGNLPETMARLGHSTVRASLLYQQAVSGRDAEIAAALSALATKG